MVDFNPHALPTIPFSSAIALGYVNNVSSARKFGHGAVSTSFDVVSAGNILWLPTVASVVRIKAGGNVADDQADAVGANAIIVEGLDGAGLEVSETLLPHATDGTLVGVTGTQLFLRVNRAYVSAAGTSESNVGDIVVEIGAGSVDVIQIDATMGQSETSHVSVPAGRSLLVQDFLIWAEGGKLATVRLVYRTATGERRSQQRFVGLVGQAGVEILNHQGVFEGIVDFWVEAFVPSTGGAVSSSMAYHLYNNA